MTSDPSAAQRRSAALLICKTLGDELSVVAKPLSAVNIRNIPDSVEPAIRNWIRQHAGKHEVYGSAAAATHRIGGRRPSDLDLVVPNPRTAANALAGIMRRRQIKCRVTPSKSQGAFVVQIWKSRGWADALDIHPVRGHSGRYEFYGESKPPMTERGINIQTAADQLLRKANAITAKQSDGRMGAPEHRNLKDTQDFIATAKMLLASMQLRSKAEQERAKKVRAAIRVWERHLKTIKGAPKPTKRKPISKARQERFIQKAIAKPEDDPRNLVFEGSALKVTERKTPPRPQVEVPGIGGPYAKNPYAQSPYAKNPYAYSPYTSQRVPPLMGGAPNTKRKTRRRKPSKKNKR